MINLSNQKDISCSVGPLWAVAAAGCIWRRVGRAALQPRRGHTLPSVTPYGGSPKLYQLDFLCRGRKQNVFFNFNSFFFQRKHSVLKLTATECCFLISWKLDGSPPGHWLCHICAFSGRPGLATPSSDPPLHQPTGRADLESAWWSGSRRCRNAISPLSSEELDGWENNRVNYSLPWCTPGCSGADWCPNPLPRGVSPREHV